MYVKVRLKDLPPAAAVDASSAICDKGGGPLCGFQLPPGDRTCPSLPCLGTGSRALVVDSGPAACVKDCSWRLETPTISRDGIESRRPSLSISSRCPESASIHACRNATPSHCSPLSTDSSRSHARTPARFEYAGFDRGDKPGGRRRRSGRTRRFGLSCQP